MSIDMYLPGLPAIATEFGAETSAAQFTLASFFIGLALGQAVHGPLADRYGRKPPLYVGLTLYVAASIGCALAADLTTLIVLRFLQAVGGCAGIVIARAIVRDCCDAHTSARVFSLLMLIMGLAPILAPFIGGWILWFAGWRAIFAVLALFGLGCLFAVWRYLQETRPVDTIGSASVGAALRVYGNLLRDRHFIGYVLAGGLAHAGMFAYITGSPHVFIEVYGVAAQTFRLAVWPQCAGFDRQFPGESSPAGPIFHGRDSATGEPCDGSIRIGVAGGRGQRLGGITRFAGSFVRLQRQSRLHRAERHGECPRSSRNPRR
jgi:DHA1 family bicyclomycin/chloramphenicol resistance-like MFS transporter